MPTENRSSNTDMISVPRDLLARVSSAEIGMSARKDRHQAAFELRSLLASSPSQPHPDPIAWMVGTAFWWTKEEAERDAAASGKTITPFGPMFDTVEVERLRENHRKHAARLIDERGQLRTQLAEAHALLREVDTSGPIGPYPNSLQARIKSALSASAELTVPAPMPAYMDAVCDKFDWTPEEALRFYAEGKHFDTDRGRTRILCTGAIASHALKGMSKEYADLKGSEQAEPSAPVESDELVSEDELRDMAAIACQSALAHGVSEEWFMQLARSVEQRARAALERKP